MEIKLNNKKNIQNISSRECFEKLSKEDNSHLVDVRTKPEWLYIGVPNLELLQKKSVCVAWQTYPDMKINVNFESEILDSRIKKQDSIFLICRSGHRSLDAAKFLTSRGFTNCYNVIDGFEGNLDHEHHRSTIGGWKYQNLPWRQ